MSEPLSSDQRACCAHLYVKFLTRVDDSGITHGWWACGECNHKFAPIPNATPGAAVTGEGSVTMRAEPSRPPELPANPLLDFEGYIIEVGDLDMGLRGSKRGRGVMLEVAEGREVCIGGLTVKQCQALAARLRDKVSVRVQCVIALESRDG